MHAGILVLAPGDDVGVATADLPAGHPMPGGMLREPVPLGHKVALRALAAGEPVLKYGVPIGRTRHPVAAGDHVHVHNLASDYLPTHALGGAVQPPC